MILQGFVLPGFIFFFGFRFGGFEKNLGTDGSVHDSYGIPLIALFWILGQIRLSPGFGRVIFDFQRSVGRSPSTGTTAAWQRYQTLTKALSQAIAPFYGSEGTPGDVQCDLVVDGND